MFLRDTGTMNKQNYGSLCFWLAFACLSLAIEYSHGFLVSRPNGLRVQHVPEGPSSFPDNSAPAQYSSNPSLKTYSSWKSSISTWDQASMNRWNEWTDQVAVAAVIPPQSMKTMHGATFTRPSNAGRTIPTTAKKLFDWYLGCVEKSPLMTKALTAALVGAFGDILSQWIRTRMQGVAFMLDVRRLATFFLCGLFFKGPFYHKFYKQLWKLGSWMESRLNSSKQTQTFTQILVDQTIGIFLFFSSYYYVYELMESIVCQRGEYLISDVLKYHTGFCLCINSFDLSRIITHQLL